MVETKLGGKRQGAEFGLGRTEGRIGIGAQRRRTRSDALARPGHERLGTDEPRIIELLEIFVEHVTADQEAHRAGVVTETDLLAQLLEIAIEIADADTDAGQTVEETPGQ